uniref:Bm1179, isoform a n=2 Tax=Brugia TaxID=6278 RepID=A0A1I9G449_BRUMA|nr:Bm1179, isoform a [Brugia malayi]
MAAGSNAISNQVSFNLFAVGHRQNYQEKVYEEIKYVLGDTERGITINDVKKLKYLYQCICETGRITSNAVVM